MIQKVGEYYRIKYEELIFKNCINNIQLNFEQIYNHKLFIVSPEILANEEIGVYKVIKKVDEYIVTFADAYHMEYNTCFNMGEAVNFMLHMKIFR